MVHATPADVLNQDHVPAAAEASTAVVGDEVAEALAAVAAFDSSAPAPDLEADMRALAEKLDAAADAIHDAEQERRRASRTFEGDVATTRDAIASHLADDFTFEIADDEHGGAKLCVNLIRRCGAEHCGPVQWAAVKYLRTWAGQLTAAASAIEETFGEKPGISLYAAEPFGHEVRCNEVEGVGFMVDNAETDDDALTQVREFLAALQASGVAG